MFIVGLAGSTIPYLLLTGFMLVLTFGFNAEVLKNKSAIPENEKEILVVSNADIQFSHLKSFDYTKHDFCSFNSTDNQKDSNSVQEISVNCYPNNLAKKLFLCSISRYSSIFCSSYFGLSPPLLA